MPFPNLTSFRGGQNDSDPPSALPDDQVVVARNVEFDKSMLGERRKGAAQIDLTGSDLAECVQCTWLHRHLPEASDADAQLYAFGWKLDSTKVWEYKDTAWNTVTFGDGASQIAGITFWAYQIAGQSLHGKLFVAYKSSKDRLHVIEDGVMRLTGLAAPFAPTAADAGSGSLSGTRYYRVRYVVMDGTAVLRRGEPSESILAFVPSGTGASITVTKPAAINEGETHWELEASTDNANFYRIARTVVATTTVSDSVAYTTGYAASGVLSETITDYTTIWSARYLVADQDRLVFMGSFEDDAYASKVGWTPVGGDPGVGNDERIAMSVDSTIDLDGLDGGPITGGAAAHGFIYVFKRSAIYKLVRTGVRQDAYEAFLVTKSHGAVPGSVVQATDETGRPVVYFLDPSVGPCVLGANGVALQPCGADVRRTWEGFNVDSVDKSATGVYYPAKRQVHWWICEGSNDRTSKRIVLHTDLMRNGRRGWAVWTGASCDNVFAACMYAENIDDGTDRSHVLKPLIARDIGGGSVEDGVIWQTDVGEDDNGAAFEARILTKPYTPATILNQFGVRNAAVLGKAVAAAELDVTLIRDYNTRRVARRVDFSPDGSEEHVIRWLDDCEMKELRALQIEFKDPASQGGQWELNEFAMTPTGGQRA